MVSTGRGGAGNITQNHKEEVGERRELSPGAKKAEARKYYSTGRGGAGNIKSSDDAPQSPQLVPQGSNTPKLTTSKITTGRGGYGNMVDNKDPQFTRKLQDVDGKDEELHTVTSSKSFSVGRGGFGNVVSSTRSNGSSGSGGANLYTVVSEGEKRRNERKEGGLILKVKKLFA